MENKELEQLLAQAKQGDQAALTTLYERTQGYAYFIARRYLQNEEDVKDILQDAYIAAFGNLDTLQEGGAFYGWLGKIVTNHCLNHLRKKKAIPVSDDVLSELADDEELIPAAWLEREEKRKEILQIIDSLPAGQRVAIVLFYLEGLSVAEIAEQMDLAKGTVKAQLHNGRKAIKAAVRKEGERGNKLYGLVAVPLLAQLMSIEAQAAEMPPRLSAVILENTLRSVQTGTGAPADSVHKAGTSSGRAAATPDSFFGRLSVRVKIAAGILAAGVVVGGIRMAVGTRRMEAAPQEELILPESSQEAPVSEPEPEPDFEISFGSESLESMLRQVLSLAPGPIMSSDLADITELAIVGGEVLIVNGEGEYELERGIVERKVQIAPGQYSTTLIYRGVEDCLYKVDEEDEGTSVERGVWKDFADFGSIPNLERLEIVYCTIEDWNDVSALSGAETLKELSLAASVLPDAGIAPLDTLSGLEKLNLNETNVRDFSLISQLDHLTEFSARACEIADIDFLEGRNLEVLQLSDNEIEDISVLVPMTGVRELNLNINAILDLSALSAMTEMEDLSLWMNEIRDISPLADMKKLRELELSSNQLSDLSALNGFENLEKFGVSGNKVDDISLLKDSPNLTYLDIGDNQIEDISALAQLRELDLLSMSQNPIGGIEALQDLLNLTDLRFSACPEVSDISPLARLTNLTRLQMGGCSISDLSPLAGLVRLEDLRIFANPISDISVVAHLPNLKHLDAYTTNITDWSPASHVQTVLH